MEIKRSDKIRKTLLGKKVVILCDDNEEAMYIDDKLFTVKQDLTEGDPLWFLKMAEKHKFKVKDVEIRHIDEDTKFAMAWIGGFPKNLKDLE